MAALDQILAILKGRKVYDSTTRLWRVYDQNGIELADPSGILFRGLHGWLLQQAVLVASVTPVIPVQGGNGGGGSKGWDRTAWRKKKQLEDSIEATLKAALSPEDRLELASELSLGETAPEILAKIAKSLTPKAKILKKVHSEWDDDEDEAVFLLLGGW